MSSPAQQALVIAFDGIEEVEALATVDVLRRAGIKTTIASVCGKPTVTGRNQISFATDATLASVENEAFDLVVLPGGPGVLELLDNPQVAKILARQDAANRPLAAICAAPKVLAKHGILDDRQATAHQSVRSELPHPSDASTVEDQHIVTSQGVGTVLEFALALVRRLKGEPAANEIAASIHFQKG